VSDFHSRVLSVGAAFAALLRLGLRGCVRRVDDNLADLED
jgi:hypothetical protein